MQKVIIRIKEVRRPISDETIGFRLQAAIPNQNARRMRAIKKKGELVGFAATENTTTAFTKQFLIHESMDHSAVGERDLDRFKDNLRGMGYSHYQWQDKVDINPL